MEFGEVVDCGDAPTILVRQIGRIELIGMSTVKIGFVDFSRAYPRPRLVLSTLMDLQEMIAAYGSFPEQFMATVTQERGNATSFRQVRAN